MIGALRAQGGPLALPRARMRTAGSGTGCFSGSSLWQARVGGRLIGMPRTRRGKMGGLACDLLRRGAGGAGPAGWPRSWAWEGPSTPAAARENTPGSSLSAGPVLILPENWGGLSCIRHLDRGRVQETDRCDKDDAGTARSSRPRRFLRRRGQTRARHTAY